MSKITLFIENLHFKAIIGLLKKEREHPQKIRIDANITINYDKNSLVDYAVLSKIIKKTIKKERFFTVEEALLSISEEIKKRFENIEKIELKLSKPNILKNACVGAKIETDFLQNKKFKG